MPRHAALNNIDHRDLRVDTSHGEALGDAVMYAPTFPAEFRNVQAHYPIVFAKTAEGAFQPFALFGFQEGQNLFLQGDTWDATYVPLTIQRHPFLIGASGDELNVHIDLDNPRVGTERGERLFLEHGGTSEYLERASSILQAIHHGLQTIPTFVSVLLQHGLLEPFVLDITLDDGAEKRLSGFYTINEDALARLDGSAFAALGEGGHLEPIYMVLASSVHFRHLIERVNRRLAADG
jgi:hypothetical protein